MGIAVQAETENVVTTLDFLAETNPGQLDISVTVPARNEEGTISQVVERCYEAFASMRRNGEVLVVNDGSTDGTAAILTELGERYPTLRVFTNRRSQGMTAGLQKMFSASRGSIVILIPGDMESDPLLDIPLLVETMESEDLDVVAGWRQGRHDNKVFASSIYNYVMKHMGGVQVHDANWVKAMRREVVESFPPLRGDWHRFLLMIAVHNGFRVGEVETHYQPRTAGSSKFGWERIPKSFLDVLTVRFLLTFSQSPMRFFGGLGLIGIVVSLLTYLWLAGLYLFTDTQIRPLFTAAGILAVISVLLFLVGFLAELIVNQGERIALLERRLLDEPSRRTDSSRGPSAH